MHIQWRVILTAIGLSTFLPEACKAQEPVTPATYNTSVSAETQALERIRRIVLNQGDDSRALASLVQLARDQPPAAAARLYADLADDYLRLGKYDQAANLLQQLLNQYADQPVAAASLLKLVRLYSSSEVNHTQTPLATSDTKAKKAQAGFLRYAEYQAGSTLQQHPDLADNPALNFHRAVIARLNGQEQSAQSWFTKLKHNREAAAWRARAQTEKWLSENREGNAPLSIILCRQTNKRPHLDGLLNDPLWQPKESFQCSYDHEFLYLAVNYPKATGVTYEADRRPRAHDADLAKHDQVQVRFDVDRDYATYFELAIDYRGHTSDRCWHSPAWNPQWYVAAQQNDTHWTVEAAIPWQQLTRQPPAPNTAWAINIQRILPTTAKPKASETTSHANAFSLLLFQ